MPILETKNLSYVYSDGTPFRVTAINNVNISIEKGEFVGIIGHTRFGKKYIGSAFERAFNAILW